MPCTQNETARPEGKPYKMWHLANREIQVSVPVNIATTVQHNMVSMRRRLHSVTTPHSYGDSSK